MISVIVETRNAQALLGPCLAAIGAGLLDGLVREVILADGGSTDDTVAIAAAVGAGLVEGDVAAAAASARGPWLMLLPATTVLGADWPVAAAAHIAAHPGRAGWFGLRLAAAGPRAALFRGRIALRATLGRPVAGQGLLLPLSLWRSLGARGHRGAVRALGPRRLRDLGSVATKLR